MHAPSLRATRYRRSLMHALAAVGVLLLAEVVLPGWGWKVGLSLSVVAAVWTLELVRKLWPALNDHLMRFFGATAHPHERFLVNSATWYATGIALLALFTTPTVGAAAVAVLGVGDPIAGLVGRRWGRIRIIHGRTVLGTASFVVAGTLAASAALWLWHADLGATIWLIAASAALLGGLAELFVKRIDDNLAVPVAAAVGAWLATWMISLVG